jgi:hypothetical protein
VTSLSCWSVRRKLLYISKFKESVKYGLIKKRHQADRLPGLLRQEIAVGSSKTGPAGCEAKTTSFFQLNDHIPRNLSATNHEINYVPGAEANIP